MTLPRRNKISLVALVMLAGLLSSLFGPHGVAQKAKQTKPEPSLKELLPPLDPLSPAKALKAFRVAPGFRVELVACEPDVVDPIALAFDENGRLFVAEDIDYPFAPKKGERALGRIRMLEDKDGDGHFETSTIFADDLQWPSGIAVYKGGIFVGAPPRIYYLKDTDGDGKADVRRVVFDGFGTQSGEDIMNNLKWGIDNWIYGASSYNGGDIRHQANPKGKPLSVRGRDFRFHPDTETFEPLAGTGDFGNTFDDWGNRFISNAGTLLIHNVLPGYYLTRNPFLNVPEVNYKSAASKRTVASISPTEPWRAIRKKFWHKWVNTTPDMRASRFSERELAEGGHVTGGAGCEIYRGGAFPPEYRGSSFTAEPACNVVIRLNLKANGVTFDATAGDAKEEFLASPDNWFRPVNVANGPDGCLYVCDMSREIIEDPSAIPDDILKIIDVTRGRDKGRIYRIVPENFKRPAPPRLGKATTIELVAMLESPNGWTRDTAQRLLYERQDQAAVVPLGKLFRTTMSPQARIHALWTLHGMKALDEAALLRGMDDPHAAVREHSVRLTESLLPESAKMRRKVIELSLDENPRVRMQVAFSLGVIANREETASVLAGILAKDLNDTWIARAVLCSVGDAPGRLFAEVVRKQGILDIPAAGGILGILAEQVTLRRNAAEMKLLLKSIAEPPLYMRSGIAESILLACADAQARSGDSLTDVLNDSSLTATQRLFQKTIARAVKTVGDTKTPIPEKLRAIRLLRHSAKGQAEATLESLIDAAHPPEVQLASIQALSAQADPQVAKKILSRWRGVSPQVHREMIEAVLRNPARFGHLLDALEAKLVLPAELDSTHRDALAKKFPADLRSRADAIFARATSLPRQQVIDKYQAALKIPGDAKRGSQFFTKHCATCHRLGPIGKMVGPDLVGIQSKTPDALLISILDPSREVAANFLTFVVTTKNGRVITGMLAGESPTAVTLRRAEGAEDTIARVDIEELASSGKSLMPDGLEQQIDIQGMADLIHFLLPTTKR